MKFDSYSVLGSRYSRQSFVLMLVVTCRLLYGEGMLGLQCFEHGTSYKSALYGSMGLKGVLAPVRGQAKNAGPEFCSEDQCQVN